MKVDTIPNTQSDYRLIAHKSQTELLLTTRKSREPQLIDRVRIS